MLTNWNKVRDQVLSGQKVDNAIIVDAMSQLNAIDQDLQKLEMKEYMKRREENFIKEKQN